VLAKDWPTDISTCVITLTFYNATVTLRSFCIYCAPDRDVKYCD